MPKIKTFATVHDYVANYGNEDRIRHSETPVPISNYDELKGMIERYINEDKNRELQKLLQSEFICPEIIKTYSNEPHNTFPSSQWIFYNIGGEFTFQPNPLYGTGQKDTYTYEQHKVAPLLEEILIHHKKDFLKFLHSAPAQCQTVLMNFTGLDLTDFDLSDIDTSKANFTDTVLHNTKGISQEALDKSLTYSGASIPKGITPFWTKEKIDLVLKNITKLKNYGQSLIYSCDEEGVSKGRKAITLAKSLTEKIHSTTKYNGCFQEDFLQALHQHDTEFNHRRYYGLKMIISNIALCVLGLGVGYIAAGLINYADTGRFLFFSQPETEQIVTTIHEAAIPNLREPTIKKCDSAQVGAEREQSPTFSAIYL